MPDRESPPTDPAAERFRLVQERKHAFEDEIESFRPSLHRYCRSLTDSLWDAEDLVQDTLLRAFAMTGEIYGGVRDLRSYLFRVATNLWIDRVRRVTPVTLPDDRLPDAPAPDEPSRPEVTEALVELVRRLPPAERVAVLLADVFDFPNAEVARTLGVGENAVKAALHRGRNRLGSQDSAPAAPPSRAGLRVSAELADAFAAAFTSKDVDRLVALMAPGAVSDVVGVARDIHESATSGTFVHTVAEETLRRATRVELRGEPVVLLWYEAERDGATVEALGDVVRAEDLAGRCTRMRSYYYCPEVLEELGRALGVPVRTNGRRP